VARKRSNPTKSGKARPARSSTRGKVDMPAFQALYVEKRNKERRQKPPMP